MEEGIPIFSEGKTQLLKMEKHGEKLKLFLGEKELGEVDFKTFLLQFKEEFAREISGKILEEFLKEKVLDVPCLKADTREFASLIVKYENGKLDFYFDDEKLFSAKIEDLICYPIEIPKKPGKHKLKLFICEFYLFLRFNFEVAVFRSPFQ
jgi:hypothetical protein